MRIYNILRCPIVWNINRLSGLPTLEHATYNCPWEKQFVFRSIPHYSNDVTLCPARYLCPGVPVCNFTLSVPVVIYIPCVPVVICVPVSRSVLLLIMTSYTKPYILIMTSNANPQTFIYIDTVSFLVFFLF